ncbi:hypothetical protein CAPTEDRAFT_200508, partial [Capitella teleta]
RIIHNNQGCFRINEQSSFLNHFVRTSSYSSQIECINYCKNNDYVFSGLSMQSDALVCYCGNEVPLEGATGDNQCRERCKGGDFICGYVGYSRIITSQALGSDLSWATGNKIYAGRWCAALQYERDRSVENAYKPILAQSDCQTKKIALCVTENGGVYNVSKGAMSWFEAQNFCYATETKHDMKTMSLSSVTATTLLNISVTDHAIDWWTQMSLLHLSSVSQE